MEEIDVGVVTHFFSKPMVAAIKVESGVIKIGDKLHFKGHSTDFFQVVSSMQIEHEQVEEAGEGDLIGIKVDDRTREHDRVLKVSENV